MITPFVPTKHKDLPLLELQDEQRGEVIASSYVPSSATFEEAVACPWYYAVDVPSATKARHRVRVSVKGGAGSGFHSHAGIPGHLGGSAAISFANINDAEKQINNLGVEHLVAIKADGSTIQAKGSVLGIRITHRQLKTMNGATVTHNHPIIPVLFPKGQPFSQGDINIAAKYGFKEMRAVSNGTVYSMQPDGTWPSRSALRNTYAKHRAKLLTEMSAKIWTRQMSIQDATFEWYRGAWERAAKDLNMSYKEYKL